MRDVSRRTLILGSAKHRQEPLVSTSIRHEVRRPTYGSKLVPTDGGAVAGIGLREGPLPAPNKSDAAICIYI